MTAKNASDKAQCEQGLIIFTYARCGATWFAQMIGSTGCMGRPEDWFNGIGYRNRGEADYPLDRAQQLTMARTRGKTANGVWGIKLSPNRKRELADFDWQQTGGRLTYVHLRRRDRIARAVSEAKAEQTDQWRSTSPVRRRPHYRRKQIWQALTRQARDEAQMNVYFAVNRIEPIDLWYEDAVADPQRTANDLAQRLEIETVPVVQLQKVALTAQSDAINDEWKARFLAEISMMTGMPDISEDRSALARLVARMWK